MEGNENVLLSDDLLGRPPPRRRGCDETDAGGKDGPPLLVLLGGVNMMRDDVDELLHV